MFTIRPFEARPLVWWNGQRQRIDLQPSYQRRGRLWSQEDKAFLVDSILNGFDIPKVYLADFTYVNTPLNERKQPYAVIDGKQRFEAIFDFFADRFPLSEKFEFGEDPDIRAQGMTYSKLKTQYPLIAERFDIFNLSVVSVITDEEAKINDLFVRLNKSKPLSGAEIRNAMKGEVPELTRRLASHRFFRHCVRFSVARGGDLNAASKLLLLEFRGSFVDTKRVQLDRLVEEGVQAEAKSFSLATKRVTAVLDRMLKVFTERDPLLSSQGILPVYYLVVRDCPEDATDRLRDFLADFDSALKANRSRIRRGVAAEEDFANFALMNRNTNDAGSIAGRYHILMRRFGLHAKT